MFVLLGHQRFMILGLIQKHWKMKEKVEKNVSTLKILSAKTCLLLYDKHRRYESFYMYFLEVSVYNQKRKDGIVCAI